MMSSAILDSIHHDATGVMGAIASNPKADDFCRELALRALTLTDVIGVAIVTPTQNAELHAVGRYGPNAISDQLSSIRSEIELALREKTKESLRLASLKMDNGQEVAVALVPGSPLAASSGVLAIFVNSKPENIAIDGPTQVALAFACDLYTTPLWSIGANNQLRSKRNATDEFGSTKLSSRQMQVLELVASGKTNERIARMLNYSVATIKNDISAVFQYFGVNNRHDAVVEAEKRDILSRTPGTGEIAL